MAEKTAIIAMAACLLAAAAVHAAQGLSVKTEARPEKAPAIDITKADDGNTVAVPLGRSARIRLAGNPTTGYSWFLAGIDGNSVAAEGEVTYSPTPRGPGIVGGGGVFELLLRTARAGKSTVRMEYKRPWEKDTPPIEAFRVTVEVNEVNEVKDAKAASAAGAVRAPTQPLAQRVQEAEMVFLGKVVNKTVDGDWARAELLVEEPLRNAEKGAKVAVTWRIMVGTFFIYDVAAETGGVAILKDKHEGRYWLRDDKFEKPEKLAEVKALVTEKPGDTAASPATSVAQAIEAKEIAVTVTPEKPYILPDGKTKIAVKKESIYLERGERTGTVQVMIGDWVLDLVPRTVLAVNGYRFEFNTAPQFKFGEVREEDMIFTIVDSCTLTVLSSRQPSPLIALKGLKDTVELDCYHGMPCLDVHTIRGLAKHFVSIKPTTVEIAHFHPQTVLGARLQMNVINNFGATAITLDYMKKTQVTIGQETITLESFDFDYKGKKLKIRIDTAPKAAQAAATVVEYGGKPAQRKPEASAEFIRVKANGKYADAKLPIEALEKGEAVEVQVKGKLTDGIMAIGGETTGTTIKARNVTWELDVSGPGLRDKAAKLNGKTVVATGAVRQQAGVEIARRTILVVKTLEEG